MINTKRVRRLYRLEGLQLRLRVRRRKHTALHRGPAPQPVGPTERWSIDFVHDALANGRPFRVLTVVDQWSRQSPILEVASSMSGATVAQALDRVLPAVPTLRSLTLDHGTEFTSRSLRSGRINAACSSISPALGNRWIMRSSNRLTAACATSA